jgi:hypothetical protein
LFRIFGFFWVLDWSFNSLFYLFKDYSLFIKWFIFFYCYFLSALIRFYSFIVWFFYFYNYSLSLCIYFLNNINYSDSFDGFKKEEVVLDAFTYNFLGDFGKSFRILSNPIFVLSTSSFFFWKKLVMTYFGVSYLFSYFSKVLAEGSIL